MCSAPPPPITEALPDLPAWTVSFASAPLPVLAETAEQLDAFARMKTRWMHTCWHRPCPPRTR